MKTNIKTDDMNSLNLYKDKNMMDKHNWNHHNTIHLHIEHIVYHSNKSIDHNIGNDH
jgi:hypothetical protein